MLLEISSHVCRDSSLEEGYTNLHAKPQFILIIKPTRLVSCMNDWYDSVVSKAGHSTVLAT